LAKEIFGDHFSERILELNASDERGIQVVREKVKKFSQKMVSKIANKNVPEFQIVILDEADSMTTDAQSALRRVIEDNVKSTRFCFICNYVSRIIDPIASRCAKYRFSPLPRENQIKRLRYISDNENLTVPDETLNFIIEIAEGDLRRSINLLQSISQLGPELMTDSIISDVCGVIPNETIDNLFQVTRSKNTKEILKEADEFFYNGYDLRQLLSQLTEYVIGNNTLKDLEKTAVCEKIMDVEIGLLEGGSTNIKLYDLMCQINGIFKQHNY
jgi:replication factor C subunit 2/4